MIYGEPFEKENISLTFNIYVSKGKTLSENLKISNTMLSNFDLVFLLLDVPDEEMDSYLSERVMTVCFSKKN